LVLTTGFLNALLPSPTVSGWCWRMTILRFGRIRGRRCRRCPQPILKLASLVALALETLSLWLGGVLTGTGGCRIGSASITMVVERAEFTCLMMHF